MRLGKGIIAQNISIIPFEERADFSPATMTPDTAVWRLLDAFCTHNGSWEVDDTDQFGIDQWARDAYLFPPNDPRYNTNGGGDHHIQICVQGAVGARLNRAGVAYSSDGAATLQPAGAAAIIGETDSHGWANIPIYAPASFPPVPGPWSMTKAPGMADILTGAGLPWNWHVSTFGVWQAMRWGDLQPVYSSLEDALHGEAQAAQVIQFNPEAALQARMFVDGFVPNSPEFDLTVDGVDYRGQRAEHLASGVVRAYYAVVGAWGDVRFVEW